jgi:hypothetical protein
VPRGPRVVGHSHALNLNARTVNTPGDLR